MPDADVGLLYSRESRWAMEFHPPLGREGAGEPDRGSYDRIVGRFYEGLFGAGLQADVVYAQDVGSDADALVARWPVLVVPALYVADDVLLDLLDAYARAGGHLVLGFRTGYADDEARPRPEIMPGRLREAVGATYGEYTNLAAPGAAASDAGFDAARRRGRHGMGGRARARGRRRRSCATSTRTSGAGRRSPPTRTGSGRVTYVGTLPDRALAVALARWLRPGAGRLGGPARDA